MTEGNMQYREVGHRVCSEKIWISPKISTVLGYLKRVSRNRHGIHVLIPRNLAHGIRSRGSGIHSRAEGPPLLDTKTPRTVRYAIITGTDLTTESSKIQILKKSKISRISMDLWFQCCWSHRRYRKESIWKISVKFIFWIHGGTWEHRSNYRTSSLYMSHISLPESQRNVTINHVCVLSGDREGIDHVYIKRALQKRSAISDVLEVLRAESVDCI
jgi:hypothetical protein